MDASTLIAEWRRPLPQDNCTLYTMGQRTGRLECADALAALSPPAVAVDRERVYAVRTMIERHRNELPDEWQDWAADIVREISEALAAPPASQPTVGGEAVAWRYKRGGGWNDISTRACAYPDGKEVIYEHPHPSLEYAYTHPAPQDAKVAESREILAAKDAATQAVAELQYLRDWLRNDAIAATFQSLAQYRTAALRTALAALDGGKS